MYDTIPNSQCYFPVIRLLYFSLTDLASTVMLEMFVDWQCSFSRYLSHFKHNYSNNLILITFSSIFNQAFEILLTMYSSETPFVSI